MWYFDSWSMFITMGGHGLYVWLSVGCFSVVIAWNIVIPLLKLRAIKKSRS